MLAITLGPFLVVGLPYLRALLSAALARLVFAGHALLQPQARRAEGGVAALDRR